ncbi:MAG: FeoB small GTPase domain-containing protein [Hyphomicrobiales bacterium]
MSKKEYTIALAGNPNTGKTTLFNLLTGLNQHTGNWPGKTVTRSEGKFSYLSNKYKIIDLPGTYSLLSRSQDEEVARNFILFDKPDITLVIVDATALERNLNLAIQVLQISHRVIVCLNLIDEAQRKGITIDHKKLSQQLGIPVIPMAATKGRGKDELLKTIHDVINGDIQFTPYKMNYPESIKKDIEILSQKLKSTYPNLNNAEWIALRLIEGDISIHNYLLEQEIA